MKQLEKTVTLVFDDDLKELLPRRRRNQRIVYSFNGPQSVKHLIESLGIPHTEVGGIFLGAVRFDLSYQAKDSDTIEVKSSEPGEGIDSPPEFVADGHLGRLASGLRMLGLDCDYGSHLEDRALLRIAATQSRHLLTRDRRLLMHRELTRGYLVRALEPAAQLAEVTHRFSLHAWLRPLTRCIRCNHLLQAVEKRVIRHRLEPLTRLYFDDFRTCSGCGQIYWRGSHVEKLLEKICWSEGHEPPEEVEEQGR